MKAEYFTVCVQDNDDRYGTTHVAGYRARSMDGAIKQALKQVRADWGCGRNKDLHVLAVLKGDVEVLLWED